MNLKILLEWNKIQKRALVRINTRIETKMTLPLDSHKFKVTIRIQPRRFKMPRKSSLTNWMIRFKIFRIKQKTLLNLWVRAKFLEIRIFYNNRVRIKLMMDNKALIKKAKKWKVSTSITRLKKRARRLISQRPSTRRQTRVEPCKLNWCVFVTLAIRDCKVF